MVKYRPLLACPSLYPSHARQLADLCFACGSLLCTKNQLFYLCVRKWMMCCAFSSSPHVSPQIYDAVGFCWRYEMDCAACVLGDFCYDSYFATGDVRHDRVHFDH